MGSIADWSTSVVAIKSWWKTFFFFSVLTKPASLLIQLDIEKPKWGKDTYNLFLIMVLVHSMHITVINRRNDFVHSILCFWFSLLSSEIIFIFSSSSKITRNHVKLNLITSKKCSYIHTKCHDIFAIII